MFKKTIHATKRRTGKVVSTFSFFSGMGGEGGGVVGRGGGEMMTAKLEQKSSRGGISLA